MPGNHQHESLAPGIFTDGKTESSGAPALRRRPLERFAHTGTFQSEVQQTLKIYVLHW